VHALKSHGRLWLSGCKIKRFQNQFHSKLLGKERREREKSGAFGEGKVIREGSSGFGVAALLSVIVGHTENMRVNTHIFTRTYICIHTRTYIHYKHTHTPCSS
jgi:hypothetical protein